MWVRALEASESRLWIEGYERLAERAGRRPATRLAYVADRLTCLIAREAGAPQEQKAVADQPGRRHRRGCGATDREERPSVSEVR